MTASGDKPDWTYGKLLATLPAMSIKYNTKYNSVIISLLFSVPLRQIFSFCMHF